MNPATVVPCILWYQVVNSEYWGVSPTLVILTRNLNVHTHTPELKQNNRLRNLINYISYSVSRSKKAQTNRLR